MSPAKIFRYPLEPEDIESIITTYFISRLCHIILCKLDCDEKNLKAWEIGSVALQGKKVSHYDFHLTKMVLASAQAKPAGNPDNIRALLIYEISHVNIEREEGEKCRSGCGLRVNQKRRERILQRIRKGYRLKNLKNFIECEDFIGAHLTEEEVRGFIGGREARGFSIAAQRKRVREYFQQV